jgi:hypothetical protein
MATPENGDRPQREVKNHMLFEIATEVAHRGKQAQLSKAEPIGHRLTEHLLNSWWNLLCDQVQGPSDDCRIWRALHPHRPPQPPVRKFARASSMTILSGSARLT